MTTDPNEVLDPTETGPQPGMDPTDNDVRQDMTPATVSPYDVEVPVTLRQRLAYARMLAQAGILPRDYVNKPANVLVAGELGREMGLTVVQSVLLIDVVEGRPSLGAKGVRATVQRAGHYISGAQIEYNSHGIPVAATVVGRRADTDQEETVTWRIERAHRAGLCVVKRDDAGEAIEVRARSQGGKVLPWEAHTEDMLDARATTKIGRALFADVTMGLSYERDELDPGLIASTAPTGPEAMRAAADVAPTPRAAAVLQQVKPARRTDLPDEYDPLADVALFPDGDWWTAAGAQVSRRNAAQLAADRIAKWVSDNPDQDAVPLPPEPSPTEPVDSPRQEDGASDVTAGAPAAGDAPSVGEPEVTVVCGYPACVLDQHDTGDHMDANGDVLVPEPDDLPPTDAIVGDDMTGDTDAGPPDDPAPWTEPDVDEPPADTMTDAGPDLDPVPDPEPPAADDGMAATAADLLAEIDAAATEVGKSRQALMVRFIASHRKNPDDCAAEELLPFVEQLRETLAARRG